MEKYKDHSTAYVSTFRSHASAKHDKSDEHNFRLNNDNINVQNDLTHKNITAIFNPKTNKIEKVQRPTPQHLADLRAWQKLKYNDFQQKKPKKSVKKQHDIDVQNSKRALKKFLENPKIQDIEKDFFRNILKSLEQKKPIGEDLNNQFLKITEGLKISRFNDKIKRIKTIQAIDFNLEDRRSLNVKQQTEYVFKIPDDNKIKLDDNQMLSIVNYFQKILPDHQMLYYTVHHDENEKNPHLHFVFSHHNKKTDNFDFIENEKNALKKYLQKTNSAPDFFDKPKKDFSEVELKQYGQLWQDFMFDIVNEATKNQFNFQKRDEKQKKTDNHTYEKTKPIAQREYNRQKLLVEENENIRLSSKKEVEAVKKIRKVRKEEEKELKKIENRTAILTDKYSEKYTQYQGKIKKQKDSLAKEKAELSRVREDIKIAEEVENTILDDIDEIVLAHTSFYLNGRFKEFRPKKWFEPKFLYEKSRKKDIKQQLEDRIIKFEELQNQPLTEQQKLFFNTEDKTVDFAVKQSKKPIKEQNENLELAYSREVFEATKRGAANIPPKQHTHQQIEQLTQKKPPKPPKKTRMKR